MAVKFVLVGSAGGVDLGESQPILVHKLLQGVVEITLERWWQYILPFTVVLTMSLDP